MEKIYSRFTLFLLGLVLISFNSNIKAQDNSSVSTKRDTVFFDNFSTEALDTSYWNTIITGFVVNDEQQAYINSKDVLYISFGEEAKNADNGVLVIKANYRPGFTTADGKTMDFTSGRIDTRHKFEFLYGSAAARMKLPEGTGLWPAFWALGNGRWPDTGEIDIMEYVGETDWTSMALHGPGYSGETPLVNKYFFEKGIDVTQWHVYSVDWDEQGFLFYVDGRIIYRATRAMIEHYGKWSYDNPKYLILNLALGGAYPVKTNGVKKPYPGIPESTVQLIKDNKAKVLVDWVVVTKNK